MSKPGYPCVECGKGVTGNRYGGVLASYMTSHNACFHCAFWLENVTWYQNGTDGTGGIPLVIDHRHYIAGWGNGPAFGGESRPYVLLNDSNNTIRDCSNMWYQGIVPDRFRDRLPDNARFAFPDMTLHPYVYKH